MFQGLFQVKGIKLNLSENGLKKIIEWEGFKNNLYRDTAGLPTIGVGHLLKKDELRSGKINIAGTDVKYANGLTDSQVKDLLRQDLAAREATVRNLVRVPLSQNQFDTLVSFVFNIGRYAFQQSTLLRVLNDGKYHEVPDQLERWIYSGGKKEEGLVNRRRNEIALWNTRRNFFDEKNLSPTIEWLIKKTGAKITAVLDGEPVVISYDSKLQQFIVGKE